MTDTQGGTSNSNSDSTEETSNRFDSVIDCVLPGFGAWICDKKIEEIAGQWTNNLNDDATHEGINLSFKVVNCLHVQSLDRRARLEEKARHITNIALIALALMLASAGMSGSGPSAQLTCLEWGSKAVALVGSLYFAAGAYLAHRAIRVNQWHIRTFEDEIEVQKECCNKNEGLRRTESQVRTDRIGWWTKINEQRLITVSNYISASQTSVRNAVILLFVSIALSLFGII